MSRIPPTEPPRQRQPRQRDRKYLDSFRDTACEACGRKDDTVVPAHFGLGQQGGGLGAKVDDSLVAGLCMSCHFQADSGPREQRVDVWFKVLRTLMRDRHRIWKEEQLTIEELLQIIKDDAIQEYRVCLRERYEEGNESLDDEAIISAVLRVAIREIFAVLPHEERNRAGRNPAQQEEVK